MSPGYRVAAHAQDRPRTAVLLQHTGIGDLVCHLPYFRAVAAQSRDGRVALIAQPSTMARSLLAHADWIDCIIDHDHRPRRGEKRRGVHTGLLGMWRMARALRHHDFDRIVLFTGRLSRALMAAMSGIPSRIGYGYHRLQRLCLTTPPYIHRYRGPLLAVYPEATALAIAHGFCDRPLIPALSPPDDVIQDMAHRLGPLKKPLYALAVGTSEADKQWGAANFVALGRLLKGQGAGVVVIGGPAEASLASEIARGIGPEALAITDTPILGSAAVLQLVDACVGNDTGMVHIAAAVGTPTHVLIGPRPQHLHDPLLRMVAGPSLASITVDQAMQSIISPVRGISGA